MSQSGQDRDDSRGLNSGQKKAAGIPLERIETATSSKPDSANQPNPTLYDDSRRSGIHAEEEKPQEIKTSHNPFDFQAKDEPSASESGVQKPYVEAEPAFMSKAPGTNVTTNASKSGEETPDLTNIPVSVQKGHIQPEQVSRVSESKLSAAQVHLSSKKKGTKNKRSKKHSKVGNGNHNRTESESEPPVSPVTKSVSEANGSDIEESETETSADGGTSASVPFKSVRRRKNVDAKPRTSQSGKELKKASSSAERSAGKIAAMEVLKAIAEASATMSEEHKKSREEVPISDDKKAPSPLKFKDCVGRKFSFPFLLVKNWDGMEELIKQAFIHVDKLGPHVADGHYDLIGPSGEIILPQVWDTIIEPGWAISMHMWPIPEPPNASQGPPPGPPPSSYPVRPPPPRNWPGGPPSRPIPAQNQGDRSGKLRQATVTDDEDEKPRPKRSRTLRKSLENRETLALPPKPPKTLFTDEGEIDNSYQAAQSMFLGKSFQAFDFKVLMVWDLLRLQREVIDMLDTFRENPGDNNYRDGFFKTLAEYRTALRDWQQIECFPRSSRSEVHAFDLHLKNQLSSDEHKRLCGTSQWLGSVINLTVNEEKAASKVRSFLQGLLPDRLAMSSDKAQYEEQLTALALGTGPRVRPNPNDVEAGADDDSMVKIEMPTRKEAYSSFVDALARLLISISGGLLLVVPMVVLVKVKPLNWRLGIVAISVLLFAIA
ncbi:hypothetical protein IFR05_016005, partial [Cadophora sp. M221]